MVSVVVTELIVFVKVNVPNPVVASVVNVVVTSSLSLFFSLIYEKL